MNSTTARATALVSATPVVAWDAVRRHDPSEFYPRFLVIPAIRAVEPGTGDWSQVGDRRLLRLERGSVEERLTVTDSPTRLAYELTGFTGFFGLIVDHATARWVFARSAEGTTIEWTYRFAARRGCGPLVRLLVATVWSRYMRRVLPPIARAVDGARPNPARRS
jgi:hypothetical protein